jgi:hypothetical protein
MADDGSPTTVPARAPDGTKVCPACRGSGVDDEGNRCLTWLGVSSEVWVEP